MFKVGDIVEILENCPSCSPFKKGDFGIITHLPGYSKLHRIKEVPVITSTHSWFVHHTNFKLVKAYDEIQNEEFNKLFYSEALK